MTKEKVIELLKKFGGIQYNNVSYVFEPKTFTLTFKNNETKMIYDGTCISVHDELINVIDKFNNKTPIMYNDLLSINYDGLDDVYIYNNHIRIKDDNLNYPNYIITTIDNIACLFVDNGSEYTASTYYVHFKSGLDYIRVTEKTYNELLNKVFPIK